MDDDDDDGIEWEDVVQSNKSQTDKVSIIEKLNKTAHEKSTSGSEQRGPRSVIDTPNERALFGS